MNKKRLEDYSNAWNEHDIDKVMEFMTEDCIFETGGGTESLALDTKAIKQCERDLSRYGRISLM